VTAFAGRAVDGVCWAVAIALLAVYCGARSYGELERREAIASFIQSRVPGPTGVVFDAEGARSALPATEGVFDRDQLAVSRTPTPVAAVAAGGESAPPIQ
jgi:hypothetical protein